MNRTAIVEKELIKAILQGDYQAGSQMETERELATRYALGRPAIREILQRLSHGGWLTLKTGKRAVVNDYWHEGNITTIVDMMAYFEQVPDAFVLYFLEMRIALTPQYVKNAITRNHLKVVGLLAEIDDLPDSQEAFALYDWKMQQALARLAVNPIFSLVLNSFEPAYVKMAMKYFDNSFRREASRSYYKKLLAIALKGDGQQAEELARSMMEKSYTLWQSQLSPDEKIGVKFRLNEIQ